MRITANPDRDLAIRVLRTAVDLGVDHIDTERLDLVNLRIVRRPGSESVAERFGVLAAMRDEGLNRSPNVLAIPGTGTVDHLIENVAAGDLRFSPAEMAVLSEQGGDLGGQLG